MSFATDDQRRLTGANWPLYSKGYRVFAEEHGFRLRLLDTFANRNEDFGLHVSEARAWEVAALLAGPPAKAITSTSNIA